MTLLREKDEMFGNPRWNKAQGNLLRCGMPVTVQLCQNSQV